MTDVEKYWYSISYMWYSVIAVLISVAAGLLVSVVTARRCRSDHFINNYTDSCINVYFILSVFKYFTLLLALRNYLIKTPH